MRIAFAALLVAVSGCTPFEGSSSGEAFVGPSLEEAFPGARVMGQGQMDLDLDDGSTITVPYVIQEGMAVSGGDMLLATADEVGQRAAAINRSSSRWSCEVPYSIDDSLTSTAERDFRNAVAHWEENTGLRFVENSSARDRIHVHGGSGCSSFVGKVGGAQGLTLSANCGRGAAIHEIGHAMGMFHEQARSDRDDHVEIHWDNIRSGMAYNFETYSARSQPGVDLGSYDVGSIMHYGSWAFSTGTCTSWNTSGCTITHPDGRYISENQRQRLSSGDLAAIEAIYGHCGEGQSQDDHGDTLDEATVVNGAMQINGRLDAGDHDVFAIHAAPGQGVRVYTSGSTDTVGDLYQNGLLVASDDTTGEGPNFELQTTVTDAALHVDVKGWRTTTSGAYTLHVETFDVDDGGDDHGDTIAQGTRIAGSTSIQGNLTASDEDYFVFDLPEGSLVTIGTSGTTDTVGDLLIDGVQVATDDTTGDGPNFELTFEVGPGQHVVRVEAWRTWITGDYTLNVDVQLPTSSSDDHGDTESTATVLDLAGGDVEHVDATLDQGDVDVYRLLIDTTSTLTVSGEGLDVRGTLYDASGAVLDTHDGADGFLVSAPVEPGEVLLFVDGGLPSVEGGYSLAMSAE